MQARNDSSNAEHSRPSTDDYGFRTCLFANSEKAAAGICTGYFPAAARLLFTLCVMLAFSKQSKLMNLAQPNSVFFSPISLGRAKEMGNKDYVHFFDTRQRNEPKKTCIGGEPPMYPPASRANAASRLLSTRGCYKVQNLLSPFKENGENRGLPTG